MVSPGEATRGTRKAAGVLVSPPPAAKPTNGNPPRGARHPAWSMDRRLYRLRDQQCGSPFSGTCSFGSGQLSTRSPLSTHRRPHCPRPISGVSTAAQRRALQRTRRTPDRALPGRVQLSSPHPRGDTARSRGRLRLVGRGEPVRAPMRTLTPVVHPSGHRSAITATIRRACARASGAPSGPPMGGGQTGHRAEKARRAAAAQPGTQHPRAVLGDLATQRRSQSPACAVCGFLKSTKVLEIILSSQLEIAFPSSACFASALLHRV